MKVGALLVLLVLAVDFPLAAALTVSETCQSKCEALCEEDANCKASCQESACEETAASSSWSELFFWGALVLFIVAWWMGRSAHHTRIRKFKMSSEEVGTKYTRL